MRRGPGDYVRCLEERPKLPKGTEERFTGYGVMGLPFDTAHVLCLRRWPASSLGSSYTSIWHRDPDGCWTFVQDAPPGRACTRYFGNAVRKVLQSPIAIDWSGLWDFTVLVQGEFNLEWQVSLGSSLTTRLMNLAGTLIPASLWRNETVLRVVGFAGGVVLGAGQLKLTGRVPNGQEFIANPRLVWTVTSSRALLNGEDLGSPAPLPEQAKIGDLWIPQRGRFFIGCSYLEAFDPSRHATVYFNPKADTD